MVPNSQRGVFASSGFVGYLRRVQKSFSDFVGFDKIGRVLNPSLFYAPNFNRRLAFLMLALRLLPYVAKQDLWSGMPRGGWVCYANDFPDAWSGCDLIMGTSFGVPFKRGVVETIGAATSVGESKEKKIKQEAVKRAELKEITEGIEVGLETKKRKTARSRK